MNNDDSRKRKATQAPNTSSKKHKSNIATTSRVTLDSPTRPTTRAKIRPVPCRRDLSPGASQSTADTYRTRSKTGSLKSTKKHPGSPSEDHTPPSTGGLSQWVAERQREKLRDIASQSSPKTSPTKKRSKAPPKPPSKSEDIIVISSDDDEKPRPRKRLRRRHTTQISEIIDLTKDETPPPPRSRPTRLRPAPLPTPTTAANLSTSASSSSPLRYLDLRYLSHKSKPKTTPPSSLSHSQTKTSPWPRKTRLPAAPSPAAMRRRRLNDMFDDDDEKSSHASKLPAVEVVINKYKVSSTAAPKVKSKPNVNPKTETKPGLGLEPEYNPNSTHAEGPKGELFQKDKMLTSKELRTRLQDEEEEEEEENVTVSHLPLNSIISGDNSMDTSPAQVVIKTEDIEDTYVGRQSVTPNLVEVEDIVAVKEEPRFDEPSSIADLIPPLIHEQVQNDLEEAIFQSMLVASAMEAGEPLAGQEGGIEESDGFSTMPSVSSLPAPINDTSTVRDPPQLETQMATEVVADTWEEADHEDVVKAKDSEAKKMSDEVVPERPLRSPSTDINSSSDCELEQQEQANLEEALLQSQLAILYPPPVSCQDEDTSRMQQEERDRDQVIEDPVDVAAPPALNPPGDLNPYEENVFVTENPDDATLTTDEALSHPVPVTTTSAGDITHQALPNDITKTKDNEEAMPSLTKFSVPLHKVAAPCPFSCSVPITAFARFVPTENTSSVFIAGQLTQRFFAQSFLPPKAKTGPVQPVEEEEEKLVMEVEMAEPVVEVPVEESQEEKEVQVQSGVEQAQSVVEEVLVQSEEIQRPVGHMEVEKSVEEASVWTGIDEMQMPAVMDVWESEVEVGTVEQQAEVGCEGWNEDGSEEGALFAPSSGDADDNVELAVSPEQGFEVLASPAPEASSDEGIGAGDMLMIPAVAVHDETDLLQASEDDVAIGVAQEDEVAQVETTSVAFPRTTDTVEPTLQPELLPPSDQIAAKVETVTLEAPAKDPISSRALRGSRMLLEIIQGVINQTELEPPKVSSAVRIEEADGETMHSPRFQTSTPEPEALPQLADHDTPFLAHEESHFPRDSTSEPFVQLADDGDISPRSTYVSPSSLRLDDDMMSEPLAEAQDPDDATSYHVTLSSARAQTLEPEPLTHEIKDVITASSGPLESNEAPRPLMPMADFLAQSEDGGVAHNRPLLEMSSSSSLQKLTEPPVFVDEAGEDGVTARTLEHVSKDELPLPLGSIDSSPFQGHRSLRAEDGGQFYVQSTVSTGDISSTPAPQRRTMSNTGSESSLATTDDSPPPPTPPQSAFEAYYIRSTSPDDGLDLDIFSKLTDIPSLPLSQSDEEDDEYLLSLDFSYPDFDVAG